jgi:hypothetical protein
MVIVQSKTFIAHKWAQQISAFDYITSVKRNRVTNGEYGVLSTCWRERTAHCVTQLRKGKVQACNRFWKYKMHQNFRQHYFIQKYYQLLYISCFIVSTFPSLFSEIAVANLRICPPNFRNLKLALLNELYNVIFAYNAQIKCKVFMKYFCLLQNVQMGCGPHSPGSFSPGVKRPGREANHSLLSCTVTENEWGGGHL